MYKIMAVLLRLMTSQIDSIPIFNGNFAFVFVIRDGLIIDKADSSKLLHF